MGSADAGDYEAPTLDTPETSANPVAADGSTSDEPSGPPPQTFDVEPSGPPPAADGQVHAL